MSKIQLEDDHYCFACGDQNEKGLRIDWKVEGQSTTAEFVAEKHFQGWKNVVHGGILATLLDEAMTRLAWIVCGGALTAEMTVRFLNPVFIGEKIFIRGDILSENRKVAEMKASLTVERDGNKIVVARSQGKAVKIGK